MNELPARYRMNELAKLTGLTPRTIRFYIHEGLLPPPEGGGPAAAYTAEHRDRLALIGLLKARYLPLQEIRQRLAPLNARDVRAELDRLNATQPAPASGRAVMETTASADAALDYLDDVLQRLPRREQTPARLPPAPLPAPRPRPTPARERWERITLADGVELHVREDRRRETTLLEAVVRQARKLLGEI
jgi:DNA-binding transcriptional MerR regulator